MQAFAIFARLHGKRVRFVVYAGSHIEARAHARAQARLYPCYEDMLIIAAVARP